RAPPEAAAGEDVRERDADERVGERGEDRHSHGQRQRAQRLIGHDYRDGGPDMAPKPPSSRRAPAKPGHASSTRITRWGPDMAPRPPPLVAPRRSRGTPR